MKKIFFIWTIGLICLFLISLSNKNTKPLIYLDPGHGGYDGGASIEDVNEKVITLEISLYIALFLESSGYTVMFTRVNDQALATHKNEDIYKRVSLINNSHALLYVSIHANSFSDQTVAGAQVFYHNKSDKSKQLASMIQHNLQYVDKKNTRKEKAITGKYLIDHVNITGCLVEVGFLSNKEEREKLTTTEYQKNLAYAIYLGIIQYLEQ